MKKNNVERAAKYRDIQWSPQQKDFLFNLFEGMDILLLTCQQEGNKEKVLALQSAHEKLHDITLSIGLNEYLFDPEK